MHRTRRAALFFAALAVLAPVDRLAGQDHPSAYLGHAVGADFRLAGWQAITGYLNHLADASPAIRVDTLGRTTQGRPLVVATVTAPSNMSRLEEIRANQARLADPRQLEEGELDNLLASQPAVVLIAHNVHGTEIAASQGVMELAYTLVTDAEAAEVLEDVVVLLIPSANPDGQQMVTDWYRRTLGTPYEGGDMPWLYHEYVGHDNNRDWFMITQVETRLVTDLLYREWFPEVVYDVHQMGSRGPRFFVPPFDDPANPNVDPLLVRTISLIGMQMSTDLEAAGKAGIANAYRFDLWWNGGLRSAPARHNMAGILSESASARLASPLFLEPDQLRQPQHGVNYPNPWPGGWWRMRDIIDYQIIAARSLISLAARQRQRLIRNYVELGRRQVEAGRSEPPFAYIVPADQRDPGSAAAMLEALRRGAVEIHIATAPFQADGVEYPSGTWVVLMAQPYRAHAKDLLERQSYPDLRAYPEGPPDTPYDATGWTLPLQMGVDAVAATAPFEAELTALTGAVRPPPGDVSGDGSSYAVAGATNAANLAVNRVLAAGGAVAWLAQPAELGGALWPVGTPVLGGPTARAILEDLADNHGLNARAISGAAEAARVSGLRLGLYQPWTASMDGGWTRWVFDAWDLPYRTLHDAEVRAGGLRTRYDVIILPDVSAESIIEGRKPGTVPAEYADGLGEIGLTAIRDFVRNGGTLICLDSSSGFAIERLGLPVRDVRPPPSEQRTGTAFYAPGSILAVTLDPQHPIAYGMPEEAVVFYSNGPVFQVEPGAGGVSVIASYPESGQLLSGYALHSEFLIGKAALVEARYGEGRVILFGFRPMYRGQSHETFKLLFNAIYHGAAERPQRLEF